MTTWYVNSAAGGTGAGTSWVNACTTLAAAITLSSAGDDFNVLNTHAETSASNITLTFKGTAASPNRVFSCGNTNSPATASDLAAGASITCTNSFGGIIINGFVYIYGVSFNLGDATPKIGTVLFGNNSSSKMTFDTCSFTSVGNTNTADLIIPGIAGQGGRAALYDFINCTFVVNNASNSIQIAGGITRFTGGSWFSTGVVPAYLIRSAAATPLPSVILISDIDLSAFGAGKTIVQGGTASQIIRLANCRLNASTTVSETPLAPGSIIDVVDCDSGATQYRNERYTYAGTLTTSTSSYNNASDGVTSYSWHVVTTANANKHTPFECFEINQWVAAGTYASSTIQITSATGSLNNADAWVETEYMGNASYPLGTVSTSGPATQLTTGSNLAAGSWATSGLGNNYKLAVPSFTVAIAGYVRFKVKVAKASLTLNIDPSVTVA